MPPITIISLENADDALRQQAGNLLSAAFQPNWPEAWSTPEEGREEIDELLEEGALILGAIDETGHLLGWIGGIDQYDGPTWELHPLAVDPRVQGQGIGRLLVEALEKQLVERGAITLYLGSDDVSG